MEKKRARTLSSPDPRYYQILMNSIKENIAQRIRAEIEENPIDNWHGITKENIDNHLIEPVLEDYMSAGKNQKICRFWTVLEEDPVGKKGYKIFYDKENNAFGLGMNSGRDENVSLGIYGSFIEALNGM